MAEEALALQERFERGQRLRAHRVQPHVDPRSRRCERANHIHAQGIGQTINAACLFRTIDVREGSVFARIQNSGSHPNRIASSPEQLAEYHEAGAGTARETLGRCGIGAPLPAADHHGGRHCAERTSAIQGAGQHVHQSFAPELGVGREHIERRDGQEVGVERGNLLEVGVQHAPDDRRQRGRRGRPAGEPKRPA